MSKVSQLITTNKRFLIEGSVEDVIKKIQTESIDSQTARPSKWLYFYELKSEHLFEPSTLKTYSGYECFVKVRKVAVKKTAIKSIVGCYDDVLVVTREEHDLHNSLVLKKVTGLSEEAKEMFLEKY